MEDNNKTPIIIFPEHFDARWEAETPDKGYLSNVIVQLEDGSRYRTNFIDPIRLQQDLAAEEKLGSPYFAEPGLIVLPQVNRQAITTAVEGLWRDGYFDALKHLVTAPDAARNRETVTS